METTEQRHKICNFCGEEIPESQRRCPYCGSLLDMGNAVNNSTQQMQFNYNNQAVQPSAADTQKLSGEETSRPQNGQLQYHTVADSTNEIDNEQTISQPQCIQPSADTIPQVRQEQVRQEQIRQNGTYAGSSQQAVPVRKTMGNGLKVFLTVLFVIIPGIGQLAGVITAILMMNSDTDSDKRSFGTALLVACILVFILASSLSFVISMAIPALH